MNHKYRKPFIKMAALAGIMGCLIDLGGIFILGNQIDGYNQLKHTMSQMGIPSSPVAKEITFCWMAMGALLIVFGLGIRFAFAEKKRLAIIASWLLILYGIGEGLVSGIFPADKAGELFTTTGIVHNAIGGVGVLAIMIFPLIMIRLAPKFRKISIVVFYIGAAGVLLFAIGRLMSAPDDFLAVYKGSWQRLYVMDYYCYLVIIAINLLSH
jgi:hypothetical membrane protein